MNNQHYICCYLNIGCILSISPDTLPVACFSSDCEGCHGWTGAGCGSCLWTAAAWYPPAELPLDSSPSPAPPAQRRRRREKDGLRDIVEPSVLLWFYHKMPFAFSKPLSPSGNVWELTVWKLFELQLPEIMQCDASKVHGARSCLLPRLVCEHFLQKWLREAKYFTPASPTCPGWSADSL